MPALQGDTGPDPVVDWIRSHLPVTAVPGLPEMHLHVADARSGLGRFLAGRPGAGPPYWAHPWAGGLVLARHLLDHAALVAGRRVVDLGCGSGVVGIAAALVQATSVCAVDVDPLALAATRANAALNGVTVETTCGDTLDGPVPTGDLILVGDLFYEATLATRVLAFLERCSSLGMDVLVGDPGRATLPTLQLEPIDWRLTRDFGIGSDVAGTVFRLRGKG